MASYWSLVLCCCATRTWFILKWRGARVVEWNGLENRRGCKLTVGSNPTLSANLLKYIKYDTARNI